MPGQNSLLDYVPPLYGAPQSDLPQAYPLGQRIENASADYGRQFTGYLQNALRNVTHPNEFAQYVGNRADAFNELVARAGRGDRDALNEVTNTLANFGGLAGMTVYHGTPHTFAPVPENPLGKFDLGKIGTGEGAQAYGHGIYLAENPKVAGAYRGRPEINPQFGNWVVGEPANKALAALENSEKNQVASGVITELRVGDFPPDVMRGKVDSWLRAGSIDKADHVAALAAIKKAEEIAGSYKGAVYHVDLPDEHIAKMLDWDKPLAQQKQELQAYLASHPRVIEAQKQASQAKFDEMELIAENDAKLAPLWRRDEMFGPNLIDAAHRVAWGKGSAADASLVNKYFKEYAPVYEAKNFVTGLENTKGLSVGDALEKAGIGHTETSAQVSQDIKNLGYPGIKYLDAGSRTSEEGSRNIVLFDPDLAKITGKE